MVCKIVSSKRVWLSKKMWLQTGVWESRHLVVARRSSESNITDREINPNFRLHSLSSIRSIVILISILPTRYQTFPDVIIAPSPGLFSWLETGNDQQIHVDKRYLSLVLCTKVIAEVTNKEILRIFCSKSPNVTMTTTSFPDSFVDLT